MKRFMKAFVKAFAVVASGLVIGVIITEVIGLESFRTDLFTIGLAFGFIFYNEYTSAKKD